MHAPFGVQEGVLVGVVSRARLKKCADEGCLPGAGGAGKHEGLSANADHTGMDKDEGSGVLCDEELQVTLEYVECTQVGQAPSKGRALGRDEDPVPGMRQKVRSSRTARAPRSPSRWHPQPCLL